MAENPPDFVLFDVVVLLGGVDEEVEAEDRCWEREANNPLCLDMESEMELRTWLRSGATGGLPFLGRPFADILMLCAQASEVYYLVLAE